MKHGRARVEGQRTILVPQKEISMQRQRAFKRGDVQGLISGVPHPWGDFHGITSM
jgi:hypothetical protein